MVEVFLQNLVLSMQRSFWRFQSMRRRRADERGEQSRRDFLLASLPSSGTTWLFNELMQHSRHRSMPEFFHPKLNPWFRDELLSAFGPDDIGTRNDYSLVPIPWQQQLPKIQEIYEKTWRRTPFTATKENHLAFKLGFFAKRFDVVVLYRHRKQTFPPSPKRKDAWRWYAALYESLDRQRHLLDEESQRALQSCSPRIARVEEKALAAHTLAYYKLLKGSAELGLPVFDYEEILRMQHAEDLSTYFSQRLPGVDWQTELIAQSVLESRRGGAAQRSEDYAQLGLESLCQDLIRELGVISTARGPLALLL